MPTEASERAKRMMIGKYADWVKRFDVNEYVQNPPLIEKLYEEKQLALTSSVDLEQEVKILQSQIHELNLTNQRLELEVNESSRKSSLLFTLSLLATILVGIGVNIATSSPDGWAGWVMIVAACILEVVAFLSRPQKGK
ncbi:MAG: hypothetical protein HZB18_17050 [Chloroflexi bacterium]|nr:hypothetical protein [Chloroflexota bacterium]